MQAKERWDLYAVADREDPAMYAAAVEYARDGGVVSVNNLRSHLLIGYNRAARIVETMEHKGIIGPLQADGTRAVLL
jgi:S-DNA-T family DNA segregation ATPase FtsK/SpoIIIE